MPGFPVAAAALVTLLDFLSSGLDSTCLAHPVMLTGKELVLDSRISFRRPLASLAMDSWLSINTREPNASLLSLERISPGFQDFPKQTRA